MAAESPLSKRRWVEDDSEMPIVEPDEYHGKTQREHINFIWACECVFRIRASVYEDDAQKVNFGAQYLKGAPQDAWWEHEAELAGGGKGISWHTSKSSCKNRSNQELHALTRPLRDTAKPSSAPTRRF